MALMQLNASCVKRSRPIVEEEEGKVDKNLNKISKFVGIDLQKHLIRSSAPTTTASPVKAPFNIKMRFFIADELGLFPLPY